MREHDVKCWPSFFRAIESGHKTFEVRYNDRDYAVGDVLVLRAWSPEHRCYSDRDGIVAMFGGADVEPAVVRRQITYVMPGGRFGLDPAWCVLGLADAEDK